VSGQTALYRLFAADGALLYIGIAKNVGRRREEHARIQPWWLEVQRQTVEWHPDRVAALKAEAEAIRDERPRYNRSPGHRSAGAGKTPIRNLRVRAEAWQPALEAAREQGRTITDVITEFLRWYLRVPGAKLPERPQRKPAAPAGPEPDQRKD
jgi:predicted GIY-YIG superfamily endonuclease